MFDDFIDEPESDHMAQTIPEPPSLKTSTKIEKNSTE